jgi:hypothetical protein
MPATSKAANLFRSEIQERIARGFTLVEDVVYVGLGLALTGAAAVLLVSLVVSFARGLLAGTLLGSIIGVLVELPYTVQLSFREHVLMPEPSCWWRSSPRFVACSC